MNSVINKIIYLPISLAVSIPFVIVNLILIPLAYMKTLLHKCMLIFRMEANKKRVVDFFIYLVLGPWMLILSQFKDFYNFIKHSNTYD